MSEFVSKWGHIEFPEPLEMVRRDSLKPGDVAWSSHYGKRTVEKVSFLGTENQSTHIFWEAPPTSLRPFSELYDSSSTVPLVSRAESDLIAELRALSLRAQGQLESMTPRHSRYSHYSEVARLSTAAANALEEN